MPVAAAEKTSLAQSNRPTIADLYCYFSAVYLLLLIFRHTTADAARLAAPFHICLSLLRAITKSLHTVYVLLAGYGCTARSREVSKCIGYE